MIVKMFLSSVVFGILFFSASFVANAQKKPATKKIKHANVKPKPTPESPKTVKINISPLSKLEDEILAEINFVRTKPAEYAEMLEGLRKYYNGTTFIAPDRAAFRTSEGTAALDEAITALKTVQPLDALKTVCADVRASREHLADLQKSGSFSHLGSNGSSPQERLKKYLAGNFTSNENIVGRNGTAREIVLMMVLDDGLPSRIHRKNLLDPRFKFAGVSNGENIKKMNLTVVVFSDGSNEIETCEMK